MNPDPRFHITEEDAEFLKEVAKVDVGEPESNFLGSGDKGGVFKGRYTQDRQVEVTELDSNGQPTTNKKTLTAGTEVAVKLISYEEDHPTDTAVVDSEILTHQEVKHPNIVTMYGVVRSEDSFRGHLKAFLILELAESSLKKYLDNLKSKISEQTARKISKEIIAGLEALHTHNRCHRDVQDANILVFKDASDKITVKLSDFGMTRKLPAGQTLNEYQLYDFPACDQVFQRFNKCAELSEEGKKQLKEVSEMLSQLPFAEDFKKKTPKDVLNQIKTLAWFSDGQAE